MLRREFLSAVGASLPASLLALESPLVDLPKREKPATKKIAVITTAYHYLSHAYHICGRFLDGWMRDGKYHYSDCSIASMYVEQKKANDLSAGLAKKHGFKLTDSIAEALTLGADRLAVDAVLLIGEHGDYPYNEKGQKLYPRFEMFSKIVDVFKQSRKSVPLFNDKHLSYDRKKGFAMYEMSKQLKFPMMAGSSLPVTWRKPELELPLGVKIEEAMVVSRGELEIYGVHALDPLQAMVERRKTDKQGVRAVECIEGEAVWKAGEAGRFSMELLDHALGRSLSRNNGDVRENCRIWAEKVSGGRFPGPRAFCLEYRDGLKATVLQLDGHVADETFAARIEGQKKPVSTLFYLPPPPGAAFLEALTNHIDEFFTTGKPTYPIERNVLTTGILDWCLESRIQKKRLVTDDLDIDYAPPKDSGFMRGDYSTPR